MITLSRRIYDWISTTFLLHERVIILIKHRDIPKKEFMPLNDNPAFERTLYKYFALS